MKFGYPKLLWLVGPLSVLALSCDSKSTSAVTDVQPSNVANDLPQAESSARVCFVDMERIFAAISIREVEQARVNQLAQASGVQVQRERQELDNLGERIKELQEELRVMSETRDGEVDQDKLEASRTELLKLADEYRKKRDQVAGIARELQRNVDAATVQATGKVWSECARLVNGVAGKLDYDYVINLGAMDSKGFPVLVGRTSSEDDITESVLELIKGESLTGLDSGVAGTGAEQSVNPPSTTTSVPSVPTDESEQPQQTDIQEPAPADQTEGEEGGTPGDSENQATDG